MNTAAKRMRRVSMRIDVNSGAGAISEIQPKCMEGGRSQ